MLCNKVVLVNQNVINYSMYTRGGGSTFVVIFLYVDDIIVASPSQQFIYNVNF